MKVEDLDNFVRVIAYDDDNHGVRIYVNGIYIDDMDNRVNAAIHILQAGQDTCKANPIVTADVYVCDLEETDEVIDRVHNLLCQSAKLTPEQEVAILNHNYKNI